MSKIILVINPSATPTAVSSLLVQAGFAVDIADCIPCREQLEQARYDAAILIGDGQAGSRDTCRAIRSTSRIPLIVINARADTQTCIETIAAGADYFLRKPFGPLELVARVNSLIQRASLRQASRPVCQTVS